MPILLCVLQKPLVLNRSLSGPPHLPLVASIGGAGQEVEMVDQGAQVNLKCSFLKL